MPLTLKPVGNYLNNKIEISIFLSKHNGMNIARAVENLFNGEVNWKKIIFKNTSIRRRILFWIWLQ